MKNARVTNNPGPFEMFWMAYPRKVGKFAARREWDRIKPDAEMVAAMLATLEWQCQEWDDPKFIPHPRTWLHQGRWEDEPVEIQARTDREETIDHNANVLAEITGRVPLRRVK